MQRHRLAMFALAGVVLALTGMASGQVCAGPGDKMALPEAAPQLAARSAAPSDDGKPTSLIAAVIKALDALGYDAGPPSDELDKRAHAAIRAFQHDHGLNESGRMSKKLVAAIAEVLKEARARGPAPAARGGKAEAKRSGGPISSGTGFVVSAQGHVLTNHHVVEGCREMRTGDRRVAALVASDEARDLAVLKLPPGGEAAILRGGGEARPGDDIVVLGYPLYGLLGSDAIVTTGTISSLAGLRDDRNKMQISAPVNPGNSGGPVLDQSGHVVGVVVSKLNALGVAKVTGDIPENVNFAVSEPAMRSFLDAQHIPYRSVASTEKLSAADVASRSRVFTVLLECFR